jgi:maleamate amidohydrolase
LQVYISHLTSGDMISNSKADNYKRCYGKNQLKFGSKPVLIVIDCVKAYHDPKSPLYAPERFDIALKSIIRLIEKCRAVGIPVVYTSVIYETPNAGGKWYTEKLPNVLCCYDAGNPFREFAEGVEPRKDEVVVLKQYSSSFFGTSLSSLLASIGCDSTILCGYSTSGCVRATGKSIMALLVKNTDESCLISCSSRFYAIWIQSLRCAGSLWGSAPSCKR